MIQRIVQEFLKIMRMMKKNMNNVTPQIKKILYRKLHQKLHGVDMRRIML